MTDAETNPPGSAGPSSAAGSEPLLAVREVTRSFGNVVALSGVSTDVRAGEVTCVLGDNGAGKSTLIKILSGTHEPSEGELRVDGRVTRFTHPRQARQVGIATVFQDLAVFGQMPVWRNFFAGQEPTRGRGPFRRLDVATMRRVTQEQLADIGIRLRDVDQPIGTLSGGERQSVAIARAIHFGARILILDEPTAALGVKQSGIVLRYVGQARDRGLGVVLITHNPHHAYLVGDRFVLLELGRMVGDYRKDELTVDELARRMAGGRELETLSEELLKGQQA